MRPVEDQANHHEELENIVLGNGITLRNTELLTLHIEKENIKFSACHFTLFEKGLRERLHGHNYSVKAAFHFSPEFSQPLVDFRVLKDALKSVVEPLDEMILLPATSKFLRIQASDREVEVHVPADDSRYVFPRAEVRMLETDNITSENLAILTSHALGKELCRSFAEQGIEPKILTALSVRIDETSGQGASFQIPLRSE